MMAHDQGVRGGVVIRCPMCGRVLGVPTKQGYQLQHKGRVYDVGVVFSVTCEACKVTVRPGDRAGGK